MSIYYFFDAKFLVPQKYIGMLFFYLLIVINYVI